MGILKDIQCKFYGYFRQKIVCEQLPMLTNFSKREWQRKGAIGLVFTLHHITDKNPNGIPTNEDLKVSPCFLEKIILKYKNKGFIFISLDQLSDIINTGRKPKHPFIAYTIDDGYLDNYTQALPVFERQQIPFTIFVATDFIDKKAILWWDILEDLILKNDSVILGGDKYQCQTFQEKWDVFRILREKILLFDQTEIEKELKEAFSFYDIDWYEPVRRQAMSWEHVKDISQHPLCTIGGHTVSHLALNKLSDQEFQEEIADGVNKLQSAIGKPIQHFAYPYGSPNEIGEREYKLISEFNFKTVFTAYGGCITESNMHQITHLPRVYLHER
jgi:peptidoglycan/xylan/chitin deacetylase (PgdA/CDA1 family)